MEVQMWQRFQLHWPSYVKSKTPINSTAMRWLMILSRTLDIPDTTPCLDDVITWKRFRYYWPFVQRTNWSLFGLSHVLAYYCMYEVQWWKRSVHMQSGHDWIYDIHQSNESWQVLSSVLNISSKYFSVQCSSYRLKTLLKVCPGRFK